MVKSKKESIMLGLTYLLCIALFGNLAILKTPIDKNALYFGGILCVVIFVAHFIVRKFYPDGDKFILTFSCILVVIGIAMLYRLNPSVAEKQLMWFLASIVVFIVILKAFPDFRNFAKYKNVYMILIFIFMPMALIIGKEVYGAKNWVIFGPISFQPSEFGKIALVLYLSSALREYKNGDNSKGNFKKLIQPGLVVMFSLGCMVLQRDLGSALIFFGISVTMLYIATAKKKYVLTCLGLFAVGSVAAYYMFGHVRQRVLIWKNPWEYAQNQSYQLVQGLYSISSGGMMGSGLGQGYPGFVPVNTTDFIFAAICEEMGMVFGIGIMIVYFLLFYRCIRTAFVTDDEFLQLNAVGFSAMIACQVLVIIGGIFALIPLTGITLPLISYGGSSMLTMFFALGILQKISEEG
ncbi:FtsW/RodA/SpoVE family cell cycle protein [Eubacterium multiforme]|uniref:Cell division protein FtsW (Lipid II flippase) n=1 Tax=Eubacterium multiforme TaxID=83339 RepID=A0ABT9UWQ8_9FIRM|nr:FtsW/RodA/SpoVE family cell cycle protein [Eubacterium multiforme]MDQ0150743.1 cell division protein FtsW (lipid II flippase) [Eubacterium multiforme]